MEIHRDRGLVGEARRHGQIHPSSGRRRRATSAQIGHGANEQARRESQSEGLSIGGTPPFLWPQRATTTPISSATDGARHGRRRASSRRFAVDLLLLPQGQQRGTPVQSRGRRHGSHPSPLPMGITTLISVVEERSLRAVEAGLSGPWHRRRILLAGPWQRVTLARAVEALAGLPWRQPPLAGSRARPGSDTKKM